MTQHDQVMNHMKANARGITSMEAFSHYNITRLAARVFELKAKGHKIGMENMKAEKTTYARYFLEKAND
jgi:hypothetical protein